MPLVRWSMDHLGPLTPKPSPTPPLLLEIRRGPRNPARDATFEPGAVFPYYQRMLESPVAGLRVGIPRQTTTSDGIDSEIDVAVRGGGGRPRRPRAYSSRPFGVPEPRALTDIGHGHLGALGGRGPARAAWARANRPHEACSPRSGARLRRSAFHISAPRLPPKHLRAAAARALTRGVHRPEVFADGRRVLDRPRDPRARAGRSRRLKVGLRGMNVRRSPGWAGSRGSRAPVSNGLGAPRPHGCRADFQRTTGPLGPADRGGARSTEATTLRPGARVPAGNEVARRGVRGL